MTSKEFDAIVVGAGIGGAGIAALLASAGWKILILDNNRLPGGRCTCYDRKGFTVDLGAHNFTLGHKGPLEEICRKSGVPGSIKWVSMVNKALLQVGDEVKPYNRKTMVEALPKIEQENLSRLFKKVFELTDQEIDALWYVPVNIWVDNFTKDSMAHTIIDSLVSQYFCIPSSEASTAEWINCFKAVVASRATAYPMGGNISIVNAFMSAVEKHNGVAKLNVTVDKILVKHDVAAGVHLNDGTEFHAPVIVSNADIKSTVRNLVGEEYFPKDYARRIQSLKYSCHPLTLKVALKEKITNDPMINFIPDAFSPTLRVTDDMKAGIIPEWVAAMGVAPDVIDASLSPPGKQLIGFLSACPAHQDWKKWEKVMLDSFYRVYPKAKGKVLWHFLETPDLINAYAGEDGAYIGVAQSVDQIHERRPSVVSPLKGLYFSSAEAGGHGIGTELAASSALELFDILS